MSGGHRRVRALTPILVVLLTVVALMLGASPARGAGHRHSAPAHQREGAYAVAQEQVGLHLVDLTIQSPALGRTAKVRLLTPNGWEQRGRGDRWPVLYLLHGCCDTYDSWTRETDVEDLRRLHNVLVVARGGAVRVVQQLVEPRRRRAAGVGDLPSPGAAPVAGTRLWRWPSSGDRRPVDGCGFGALSYAGRNPGCSAPRPATAASCTRSMMGSRKGSWRGWWSSARIRSRSGEIRWRSAASGRPTTLTTWASGCGARPCFSRWVTAAPTLRSLWRL